MNYNKNLEKNSKIGVAISTAFGCSIEGEISNLKVLNLVEKILKIGVDEITIADTVGYANPKQVRMLFKKLINLTDNLKWLLICNDSNFCLGGINSEKFVNRFSNLLDKKYLYKPTEVLRKI